MEALTGYLVKGGEGVARKLHASAPFYTVDGGDIRLASKQYMAVVQALRKIKTCPAGLEDDNCMEGDDLHGCVDLFKASEESKEIAWRKQWRIERGGKDVKHSFFKNAKDNVSPEVDGKKDAKAIVEEDFINKELNLRLPATKTEGSKVAKRIKPFLEKGYVVTLTAVWASDETCRERGARRAAEAGKAYGGFGKNHAAQVSAIGSGFSAGAKVIAEQMQKRIEIKQAEKTNAETEMRKLSEASAKKAAKAALEEMNEQLKDLEQQKQKVTCYVVDNNAERRPHDSKSVGSSMVTVTYKSTGQCVKVEIGHTVSEEMIAVLPKMLQNGTGDTPEDIKRNGCDNEIGIALSRLGRFTTGRGRSEFAVMDISQEGGPLDDPNVRQRMVSVEYGDGGYCKQVIVGGSVHPEMIMALPELLGEGAKLPGDKDLGEGAKLPGAKDEGRLTEEIADRGRGCFGNWISCPSGKDAQCEAHERIWTPHNDVSWGDMNNLVWCKKGHRPCLPTETPKLSGVRWNRGGSVMRA